MLIPEPVEAVLNFPWHLTKGIANLSLAPLRAVMNTTYMPATRPLKEGEESVRAACIIRFSSSSYSSAHNTFSIFSSSLHSGL